MITAYFDESGESDKILTVAGLVASGDAWDRFGQRWDRVLAKYGITFFHMVDCESGKEQFTGWPKSKRNDLVKALIPLIGETVRYGVAVSISPSLWERRKDEIRKVMRLRHRYHFCASWCVWRSIDWMKANGQNRLATVFDDPRKPPVPGEKARGGLKGSGDLEKTVRKMRAAMPENTFQSMPFTLADTKDFPGLQAADVFAYEMYKETSAYWQHHNRPRRKSLIELLRAESIICEAIPFNDEILDYHLHWLAEKRLAS